MRAALTAAVLALSLTVACTSETPSASATPRAASSATTATSLPSAVPTSTPVASPTASPEPLRADRLARTRWSTAGVSHYRFTFERLCLCPREWSGPTEVTVAHGLITSATVEGQPAPQGAALTITDLFDEIQNALNHPVATVITYDEALGYPLDVQLDLDAIAVDGGLSLTITDFERLD